MDFIDQNLILNCIFFSFRSRVFQVSPNKNTAFCLSGLFFFSLTTFLLTESLFH